MLDSSEIFFSYLGMFKLTFLWKYNLTSQIGEKNVGTGRGKVGQNTKVITLDQDTLIVELIRLSFPG